MTELHEKIHRTSIFVAKLLFAGIVFRLMLLVMPSTYQLQSAFAELISFLMNIAGIEAFTTGTRIFTEKSVYLIVQDCLGWKSIALFIGLIYASTKRTLEHLNYVIAATAVLMVANIARVFTTVYLAESGLISFQVIHGVLWRWSLTIVVLVLWLYWFKNRRNDLKFESRIQEQLDRLNQTE
ncbi:MAG: archaeosortase/exosortase family protein [Candidatus Nanohaloarchaea archaeon]